MKHSLSVRRPPLTSAVLTQVLTQLGPRDRLLAAMVDTHRVLTGPQLTRLAFGAEGTARARLRVLTDLRVLARFRPRRDLGSAPWHYVLDAAGWFVLAADAAQPEDVDRQLGRFRVDKRLAWAASQRLGHLVGVNDVFTALARTARATDGAADSEARLATWASGTWCADWLSPARLVPDGFGSWIEDGQVVDFFLEYDTGTEHLPQLAAKLDRYACLLGPHADPWLRLEPPEPWVLFVFPSPGREATARHALAAHSGRVPIATATLHAAVTDPAGPCWLPLTSPGGLPDRHRLADLGRLAGHPTIAPDHRPCAPDDLRLAPSWPRLPSSQPGPHDPRPVQRSTPSSTV